MNKNILICVSGLTPQIITETLFCLYKLKKIEIDELYVVTTSRGKDVIMGKEKYASLKEEMIKMCNKYNWKVPKFECNDNFLIVAKEESIELNDIRNDSDNKLMPNKICQLIKEKSISREVTLHCSISGGRKTMSTYMGFALSLFGRENDKLYHVLTSEKFEFKNFFPENKNEEKALEISELPYVRLRDILAKKTNNKLLAKLQYTDLVSLTQKELSSAYGDILFINFNKGSISYRDNVPVHIPPKLFKLYRKIINKQENLMTIKDLSECFNIKEGQVRTMITNLNSHIRKSVNDIDLEAKFMVQKLESQDFGKKRLSLYGVYAGNKHFKYID